MLRGKETRNIILQQVTHARDIKPENKLSIVGIKLGLWNKYK